MTMLRRQFYFAALVASWQLQLPVLTKINGSCAAPEVEQLFIKCVNPNPRGVLFYPI